ncbi:hypothetical protein Nepgr_025750 [Nepenthes gracilis]|uniref:Uncharacterized protein n=1 Tax=Nepenthes gracilis TaxID=150966 RepID=A0AAD3XZT0_NEPGR|nr:hypothetical protein Nepgr_025750 [Nepenthes gracilis]
MIMDSQFGEFSDDIDGYQFLNGTMSSGFNEPLNYSYLFDDKDPSFNPPSPLLEAIPNDFTSSSSDVSPGVQSPMIVNPTFDLSAISSATTVNLVDPIWITDSGENEPSVIQTPAASSENETSVVQTPAASSSTQNSTVSQWSFNSLSSLGGTGNGSIHMSLGMVMDLNFFSQRESMIQFQRGVEEASKFLPKVDNLFIDLENITLPNDPKEPPAAVVKMERADSLDGSRGRKVHHREDVDFEDARSSKRSAVYLEENELSEMFDKVLLWVPGSCCMNANSQKGDQHSLEDNDQSQGSNRGKGRSRKSGDNKFIGLKSPVLH